MRREGLIIVLAAMMVVLLSASGRTLSAEISLEELVKGASHIVLGQVSALRDGGPYVTLVDISVEEVLKGRLSDRTVVVRTVEAREGGVNAPVGGQPVFQQGDHVLVFLSAFDGGVFTVYGLSQGVLEPHEETIARVKELLSAPGAPWSGEDYFPMQDGMTWQYESRGGAAGQGAVDRIRRVVRDESRIIYVFESHVLGSRRFVKEDQKVVEITPERIERLWYDFSASVGTSWIIEGGSRSGEDLMDGTTVTVVGREEVVETSFGTAYKDAIHFSFQPRANIADAGLMEEWFAPGVGCVKRVVQSIAGPVVYELVGTFVQQPVLNLSLQVTTDKYTYNVGESIQIGVTVRNEGENDVTLRFRSGLQADYMIDGIYRWSADKFFTEALTSVIVPAGGSHTWTFVHRPEDVELSPGLHTIRAFIIGYEQLRAETEIALGPLAEIRGIVTDAASGAPIPGVQVTAYPAEMWRPDEDEVNVLGGSRASTGGSDAGTGVFFEPPVNRPIPISPPMPGRPYVAVTDAQGAFTISNLPVGGKVELQAIKDGYDPVRMEVEVNEPVVFVEMTLHRTKTGRIEGVVFDDAGDAVPGAEVLVYPEGYYGVGERSDGGRSDLPGSGGGMSDQPVMPPPGSREYATVSDREGRFTIDGIPVGRSVRISAFKDGYEPTHRRIKMDSDVVSVRLLLVRKDATVENIVAEIRNGVRYALSTDKLVYGPEEAVAIQYRATNLQEQPITFEFPTAQQVDFALVSSDGDELWRWSDGQVFAQVSTSVTLAQGESAMFEASLDLSRIHSNARGFVLKGWLPLADAADGTNAGRRTEIYTKFIVERETPSTPIQPGEGVVIEGTVWEAFSHGTGHPLAGVEIVVRPSYIALRGIETGNVTRSSDARFGEDRYRAVTDGEGHFVIGGLRRGGTYDVTAYKHGYEAQTQTVYAIQDRNSVRFLLSPAQGASDDEPDRYANVAQRLVDGIHYELATDRHFYGRSDVIRMRYKVTNLRDEPMAFTFSTGQQVDFVLRKGSNEVWRWSADKVFPSTPTSIELNVRESVMFKEQLDLRSLRGLSEGGLTLTGHLALYTGSDATTWRNTEVTVRVNISPTNAVIRVGSGTGASSDDLRNARHAVGMYVRLRTPSAEAMGRIELGEVNSDDLPGLSGYTFLKTVDFKLDPVLAATTEGVYVEMDYDEAEVEAMGAEEAHMAILYWDESSDVPRWREIESGVNTEADYVWADVPQTARLALSVRQVTAVVELDRDQSVPTTFTLRQNYPNPFNPLTTIQFSIPDVQASRRGAPIVELTVFNALGQKVKTLVDEGLNPGVYQVTWDGRNDEGGKVSSGVYFYRLSFGSLAEVKRMLLIE